MSDSTQLHAPLPVRQVQESRGRRLCAFTLIELLVVIGIIALLAGILIPVIGHVRVAAYEANTKAEIQTLSGAIEQYHNTFNFYPGPLSNAQVVGGSGATAPSPRPTGTENLTLGLLGGLIVNTANKFGLYQPGDVGQGPLNLNPAKVQRYPALIDGSTANLQKQVGGVWNTSGNDMLGPYGASTVFADTTIPEFMDRFPDPLPILYIRASIGATGITKGGVGAQYNTDELKPYNLPEVNAPRVAGALNANQNDYFLKQGMSWSPAVYDRYFGNPANAGSPYQKDGFILISAGKDRVYGSTDDICNFGSPK